MPSFNSRICPVNHRLARSKFESCPGNLGFTIAPASYIPLSKAVNYEDVAYLPFCELPTSRRALPRVETSNQPLRRLSPVTEHFATVFPEISFACVFPRREPKTVSAIDELRFPSIRIYHSRVLVHSVRLKTKTRLTRVRNCCCCVFECLVHYSRSPPQQHEYNYNDNDKRRHHPHKSSVHEHPDRNKRLS